MSSTTQDLKFEKPRWGEAIVLVQETPPSNPKEGQLWFDKVTKTLKIYEV